MSSPFQTVLPSTEGEKYIYETKRDGIRAIVPHPKEAKERIPFITELRGRKPEIVTMFLAGVEWEVLSKLESRQKISYEGLDPTDYLRQHAPSLQGKRADQIVQIAKSESQAPKGGMWGPFSPKK